MRKNWSRKVRNLAAASSLCSEQRWLTQQIWTKKYPK